MGPAPKKPDPIAVIPRPGFDNPMYPTIGQKEPTGTVRSSVDVSQAIGPALQGGILDVVKPQRMAWRAAQQYIPGITNSLTGDASRQAYARATGDITANALRGLIAETNQAQQTQAEKSRGEDVLAQRHSTQDNWKANTSFQVYGTDIRTDFVEKVKELAAYYQREKKNSEAMVTASLLRML
jgi:hypothetical protein